MYMKKILFIIYYEAIEYLLCIKEQLEKFLFEVITYPLFRYAYDSNDKINNYQEHLNQFINDNEPDIILWWFIDVPISVFKYIKESNKKIYFILHNFDDPVNLSNDIFEKCKLFDLVITPCKNSIYLYKLFSKSMNVIYQPIGFDQNYYFPIKNLTETQFDKYKCDIAIYCNNLFIDKDFYPNQYINTYDLIKNIVEYSKKNNKKFNIYGTHIIKEYFPENYFGNVSYCDINLIYNNSHIVLTTHADSETSVINDTVMTILGTGSILFIDKIKDINNILTNNVNCIMMEKDNYVDQIDEVLNKYSSYDFMKENAVNISFKYTWEIWTKQIFIQYSLAKFDNDFYSLLYGLDVQNLINYWTTTGINNMDICYNFNVPDFFDHQSYIETTNLISVSKEYTYMHWRRFSKNIKFIIKQKQKQNFDPENFGITIEQYYQICNVLNKIKSGHNKTGDLFELFRVCNNIPYIKINDIIEQYYDTCE